MAGVSGLRDLRPLVRPVYAPSLVYSIGVGALAPATVLLGLDLGLDASAIAAWVAAGAVAAVVGSLVAGQVVDAVGERAALVGATALSTVVLMALCAAVWSAASWAVAAFVLAVVVVALVDGVWAVARQALLAERVPAGLRGRAMNTYGAAQRAGRAIGPALAGAAILLVGPVAGFAVHAITAVAACALITRALPPAPPRRPPEGALPRQGPPAALRFPWAAFWLVGAGALAMEALRTNRDLLAPLWATQQLGLTAATVSGAATVGLAMELALFLPAGIASDRWGPVPVAVTSLAVMAAGFAMLLPATQAAFWAGIAVIGLGNGIGAGVVKTLAVHLAPVHRRATFLGRFTALSATGALLGPALLIATPTLSAAIIATAVLGAGAALWLTLTSPRHLRRSRPQPDPGRLGWRRTRHGPGHLRASGAEVVGGRLVVVTSALSSQAGGVERVGAVADTLGLGGIYRDPLLRVEVVLSDLERDLLGTWWVRRLGYVAHAGAFALCTAQSYSRLEHSLGLVALVAHLSPDDRLARVAALVHDVGHTPFSHTLEGIAGCDHHDLGARRVGEMDALLRDHGVSADRVLDVVEGRIPSALGGGGVGMGLDHLESFLRSGQAHGRTREMPSTTLGRLRLRDAVVDTDAATADYLVDLVAGEAASQCSPINLVATAVLRDLVEQVLDGASPARRGEVAAMSDDELLAALAGDARTAEQVHLLRADPTAWHLAPAADGDGDSRADGSIPVELGRLYLALPLVDGQEMDPDHSALAGLAATPARFTVRRAKRRDRAPSTTPSAGTPGGKDAGGPAAPGVGVGVRSYAPADAVATYEVFHAAVRRTALACYSPAQVRAWAPDEVDMDRWAARRAAAWTIVAVERDHDRVIAFADLTDAGEMDMLFVHPDHARAGIAATLVARVVDQATSRGLNSVEVHASKVLQPLLTRLGFTTDQDHVDNHRRGQVLVNATMHLDLHQPPPPTRRAGRQHP